MSARTAILMVVSLPLNSWADDTKAPLGDRPPEKTGFIPSLSIVHAPEALWQFTSAPGEAGRRPGLSDPATSGGMLFFGDDLGVVRAVTAREGVPIWTHEHGERVFFPPTCDGDRLFFTTRRGITALQSASGIHMWHRPVSHSVGRCVAWKETDTVFFSDSDGWMYALDAATGDEKWKTSFVDDAPEDPPGFDGDRARFEDTAARPTGIATDGKMVYQCVFDQCRVVSFACESGERTAVYQTQGWLFGDPAVDDERLYVGSQDEHLYCFNKATGEILWKHNMNSRVESGPGVTGNRVVVGSCDGRIYCCNKRTGALLWVMATGKRGAIYSAPIVTEDTIYVAVAEGTFYALAVGTGEVRWKQRPSETSNLYSSPATDGTRIFIKSRPKDEKTGEHSMFAIGPDSK